MLLVGERGWCFCLLLLLLLRFLIVWMGAGISWRKRGREFYDDERRTEERGGGASACCYYYCCGSG